jgi:hypothetical protein
MIGDEKKGEKNCRNKKGTGKETKKDRGGWVRGRVEVECLCDRKYVIATRVTAANSWCHNG